jgi:WD40 repeat protein
MTSTLHPSQAFGAQHTFGEPRLHTDGEVLLLAFAPDGSLLSVEDPGVLRRWNPANGQPREWHALSDLETLWAFSHDTRVLASASDDLTIWDASSGNVLTSLPQGSWVTGIAFQKDPAFVATGHDDGSICYWDAPGHHLVFETPFRLHQRPISALAISPDGKLLAAASEDKTISVWDLSNGTHLGNLVGHTDRIPALVWHPSGRYLVSAGWDTTARVWDMQSRQPLVLLNSHSTQVTALAFSPDGRLLASADSALAVHVWDFDARKERHVLRGPQAEVRTLAFSPDGTRLACNGDRIVHLWDVASGQPQAGTGPRPATRTAFALSRDGSRLVSNGGGTSVRIWDTKSRQPGLALAAPGPVHALAYSPEGRHIAGALGDRIRVWDATTGALVGDWDGPVDPITVLAYSPDGTLLASGSAIGYAVWLWRTSDGEPVLLIPDALDGCAVEALAFHPDGDTLAVGGIDYLATGGSSGAVSFWNIPGRYESTVFLGGTTAIAFHPSGLQLAATTLDGTICIWGVHDQQLLTELTGHEGTVTCLAYSSDGKWLVSGSDDFTLRLWSEQGEEYGVLETESQISAVAFAPDGRSVYVAHANTTCSQVQLTDLATRSN